VAPGTAGQLQMPAQRAPAPGLGELFGQMLPTIHATAVEMMRDR